jgi:hypothetical protein
MTTLTPDQLRRRDRVEGVIRLMAPALDVLLAVGDRVSRIVERGPDEYHSPRVASSDDPRRMAPRSMRG